MMRKRPRAAVLLFLLLVFSGFASGSLPLQELSTDRYMQHVSFLASDDLKGRGNGSAELERAAEYIAAQFRSYGLQPAGDKGSYFQKFDITVEREYGPKNTLQVAGMATQKDKDFVTMPVSSSGIYEGPIVFVGYGMTSESLKWDDYAGVDVRGKAVLAFRHDPEETNPSGRFAKILQCHPRSSTRPATRGCMGQPQFSSSQIRTIILAKLTRSARQLASLSFAI